jgi:diamine N-acetyltransferase
MIVRITGSAQLVRLVDRAYSDSRYWFMLKLDRVNHREDPMSAELRKAQVEDAAVIALLGRITFSETFAYLFNEHQDDLRAYLDATFDVAKIELSLSLPENSYWLAYDQGMPVGYAKLKHPSPTPLLPWDEPAQLQKIYVLRDFLGQGIGQPLLQAVLDHAAMIDALAVWLTVLQANARAIRFYEAQGFSVLGDNTYAIGAQTFDFHLMARGT